MCLAVAITPSVLFWACLWLPAAMSILQKIEEIEAEMAKTQKNKATAYVLGCLGCKRLFCVCYSFRVPVVLLLFECRALQAI